MSKSCAKHFFLAFQLFLLSPSSVRFSRCLMMWLEVRSRAEKRKNFDRGNAFRSIVGFGKKVFWFPTGYEPRWLLKSSGIRTLDFSQLSILCQPPSLTNLHSSFVNLISLNSALSSSKIAAIFFYFSSFTFKRRKNFSAHEKTFVRRFSEEKNYFHFRNK